MSNARDSSLNRAIISNGAARTSHKRRLGLVAAILGVLGFVQSVSAQTALDWNPPGGGSVTWATGSNWGGTAPANSLTTNTARFNQTSYSFQPTATSNVSIAGLIIGDGVTATAPLTITTATGANRLNLGASGIVMNANAGTTTIGSAATEGVTLGASQTWQNDSSSQLFVYSVANDANATPFTLTLGGSGSGGIRINNALSDGGSLGTTAVIVKQTGSGVVTFSASNPFTGGLTVKSGTLAVSSSNTALGSVTNNVVLGDITGTRPPRSRRLIRVD